MKIKLGKILDLVLPVASGFVEKQIDKRAAKRERKRQKKELDKAQ